MRSKTVALAAGGVLALTTIGGVAVAVPALQAASTATEDATPDAATGAERPAGRTETIAEHLAGLVTDGTITQDQADAVARTLAEAAPEGRGAHGHSGPGAMGDVLRQGLATAATTLGLEDDAVRDRLLAGETLGEVADAEGVDRRDLVSALVTEAEKVLTERVTAGDLTQAEADEIGSRLTERITEGLDRTGPAGGPGMRGGPGGQGDDGPPDDSGTDDSGPDGDG